MKGKVYDRDDHIAHVQRTNARDAARINVALVEIIDRYCNCNDAKNGMHLVLMVNEALETPPLSSGSSHSVSASSPLGAARHLRRLPLCRP